jgi:cytochrome c-type biogenesis protein CcmF
MRLSSLYARETHAVVAGAALLLLTTVVFVGTVLVPVSTHVVGTKAVVGPDFYNAVLVPTGLLLLSTTVAVPLLRWGAPPSSAQRRSLWLSFSVGAAAALGGLACGVTRPAALIVIALAAAAPVALAAALVLEVRQSAASGFVTRLISVLRNNRRSFAGFIIHLGFVAVAIGVTGSSFGSQRRELVLDEGESIDWAGRQIRYQRLIQTELPDKLVAEAELEISEQDQSWYFLRPARHFHLLQEQWTTEVDIHSSWRGDFYTILNNGESGTAVSLTFVDLPLMRWLWLGGGVSGVGVIVALWPARRKQRSRQNVAEPFLGNTSSVVMQRLRQAA